MGTGHAWSSFLNDEGSLLCCIENGEVKRVTRHDFYMILRMNRCIASVSMRICSAQETTLEDR